MRFYMSAGNSSSCGIIGPGETAQLSYSTDGGETYKVVTDLEQLSTYFNRQSRLLRKIAKDLPPPLRKRTWKNMTEEEKIEAVYTSKLIDLYYFISITLTLFI